MAGASDVTSGAIFTWIQVCLCVCISGGARGWRVCGQMFDFTHKEIREFPGHCVYWCVCTYV